MSADIRFVVLCICGEESFFSARDPTKVCEWFLMLRCQEHIPVGPAASNQLLMVLEFGPAGGPIFPSTINLTFPPPVLLPPPLLAGWSPSGNRLPPWLLFASVKHTHAVQPTHTHLCP